MNEAMSLGGLLVMLGLRSLRKYKKTAIRLTALFACFLVFCLLRSFIEPADAINPYTTISSSYFYGDEVAYYCAHYGLHGSSVVALCQAPSLAAASVVTSLASNTPIDVGSCYAYDALFRQYPWDVTTAEAICQAESGGNPYAVSATNDYGLMQLHNEPILDPAQNIAAAYRKYEAQGWGAWTTYNTGRYEQFL
jgi:hypothetical protein